MEFGSVQELDNYQDSLPQNKKLNTIEYLLIKKSIEIFQQAEDEDELFKKVFESIAHNFPKVLFIYMPIFAFWLWLFHSKKRWYFFDYAIFTLHYFAFMLLLFTIFLLADYLFYLASSEDIHKKVSILLTIVFSGYSFIYFFMAHKRMYYDKSIISFIKSSLLLSTSF